MKENQRVRLSKKLLKESLIQLLQQNKIHSISVREICDRAQINRTTFYKYYGSQYDLLGDMEDDVLAAVDRYLDAGEKRPDIIWQLTQIINYINENFDLCKILLNNNVDPGFPERIFKLPRIRQIIAKNMQVESGEELEYFFRFLIDGSFGLIKMWLNKENREPAGEIARLLNQVIVKLGAAEMA
ncbi:MAG: TetR/AcrR family transcriptional regulator [Oscillospiraceae bacterium]|jgi:AcrR family transcriptional regulator|nr:TetR/AcrR family transcriptional regulator [Oscillospiraceae bacterium]